MIRDGAPLAMTFETDGHCFWLFSSLLRDEKQKVANSQGRLPDKILPKFGGES
jgi:hypothetical protein